MVPDLSNVIVKQQVGASFKPCSERSGIAPLFTREQEQEIQHGARQLRGDTAGTDVQTCEGERGGEDARRLRRVAGVLEHEDQLLAAGGVDAGAGRLGARLEVRRRRQRQRLAAGRLRDCGRRRRQRGRHEDGSRWLRGGWRRPRRGRRG